MMQNAVVAYSKVINQYEKAKTKKVGVENRTRDLPNTEEC